MDEYPLNRSEPDTSINAGRLVAGNPACERRKRVPRAGLRCREGHKDAGRVSEQAGRARNRADPARVALTRILRTARERQRRDQVWIDAF